MKSRVVNTKFWTDTYVTELDPSEKLVFIYLITNNLTNISGVYEITLRQISFDTGFELETIKRILGRFEKDKKILYKDGWLALRNFIKNQNQGSPQVQKGIKRELDLAPLDHKNFVLYGIDTLSHLTKPNLTKPNLTLEERSAQFQKDLRPYLSEYPKEMLNNFYLYWTEPSGKLHTKMRWELEKTWDLGRRLKRWHINDKKWDKNGNNKHGITESELREFAESIANDSDLK